jgi:D-alanine-D-alanine ligase
MPVREDSVEVIDSSRALQIAIVCGGAGHLRGESLASASVLAQHLSQLGHSPTLIDLVQMSPDAIEWPGYQVCHVALADDGAWHRQLQSRGVPHTGSSAEAVELAASRTGARQFFLRFDVPTPAFVMLRSSVSPLEAVARVASLGYPLLVRSDDRQNGETWLVRNADELCAQLELMFASTSRVMCERYLSGRAFSVILQGEHALPPVSACRLSDETSESSVPLSEHERRVVEHVASMAGVALGASGLVQVDVVLDDRGRPWVLEVNPLPCLGADSSAARAAAQAGLSLSELCQWMVQDCLMAESMR